MKLLKNKNKKIKKENIAKPNFILKFLHGEDKYSNKDILIITFSATIFGFVFCLFSLMLITGGKNILSLCTDLKDFVKAYSKLTDRYYEDIDKKDIVSAAIAGMYEKVGDDYTTYIDPNNSKEFDETINGTYEGIGCEVIDDAEKGIVVYNIFKNQPADKAGLKVGDIIKSINNEDYTSKTGNDLANYIKYGNESKMVLTVEREGQKLNITINRKKVEIPTVSSKIYEKENKTIGYIQISSFSSITKKQVEKNLKELEKKGINSLIIDVRDNGGGYLNSVTDIADLFLKKDKIIYKLETSDGTKNIKSKTNTYRKYPIAILTNHSSASASEILTAALKESYGGFVIGTSTYGKGTVQETLTLSDGSKIKYTTKKWLTPDGNWINETGIEPTWEVKLPEEYFKNPIEENDSQLQKALEILSN